MLHMHSALAYFLAREYNNLDVHEPPHEAGVPALVSPLLCSLPPAPAPSRPAPPPHCAPRRCTAVSIHG